MQQNMIQILDLFEFKRPITEYIVPGINPNAYCITNFGRVWSNLTNSFRSIGHYRNGYCKLNIRLKDGSDKTLSIHRLVAMAFNPVPNMDTLEVNHIDGNKDNNHISNLEWVTHYDNMKHARETGLLNINGENAYNATLTDVQVEQVCRLLSNHFDYDDILVFLGEPVDSKCITKIRRIKDGYNWKYISRKYDFNKLPVPPKTARISFPHNRTPTNIFSEEEVRKICECFSQFGTKLPIGFVMKYIGKDCVYFNTENLYDRLVFVNEINDILRRKKYTYISQNYKF